jgi:hypothetical protein
MRRLEQVSRRCATPLKVGEKREAGRLAGCRFCPVNSFRARARKKFNRRAQM